METGGGIALVALVAFTALIVLTVVVVVLGFLMPIFIYKIHKNVKYIADNSHDNG
jgi:hypothetical protein